MSSELPFTNHFDNPMKDPQGRFRTGSLFWELRRKEDGRDERLPPIFTTKEEDFTVDGVTYKSLKKVYMSYDHIPGFEYDFAMDTLGSWDHWQRLCTNGEISKLIKDWRTELEIKIKAEAMKTVLAQSRDREKGLTAARTLLGEEHKGAKRGRPSKEEVQRQQKIEAGIRDNIQEDMDRLGISVVK